MASIPPALRALAGDAARGIGRSPADAEPFARILVDNWFDSPESVSGCRPEELAVLGIPLRFAQTIVSLAAGGAKSSASRNTVGGGRESVRRPSTKPAIRPAPPPPQQRNPTVGSKDSTRRLKIKDMDPLFRARGCIIGARGRNLHHIQDVSRVKVDLRGDGQSQPMELVFSEAPSGAAMEQAIKTAKSLLSTVYAEYAEWQKGHGVGGVPPGARGGVEDAEFRHSIEVAESDPAFAARGRLLGSRGKNIREIEVATGATVKLQGESGEAMRFEIGASSEDQLAQAQDRCEELIAKVYTDYDEWLDSGGKEDGDGGSKKHSVKRQVGGDFSEVLELQEFDPGFTLRGKLLGARGSRLRKIEETGAAVSLVGEGEPTHMEISAPTQETLDEALRAASELIEVVCGEYETWLAEGDREDGKGRSRGQGQAKGGGARVGGGNKGAGRGEGLALKKVLKLKECDPAFDLRNKLKGTKCVNLHHIQDVTSAQVWVIGERDEPVRLEIAANDQTVFDRGLQMAKDLIKSVFKDYDAWQRERGLAAKRQRLE